MCGIVGIVSNCSNGFSAKEMALFSQLLFLDTVRGWDSTGVFGVENTKNVVIHKEASHGLDFLRSKEYGEFKTEMIHKGKFVVGHNRAATRGTVVDKNAHPFWVDDRIVLVQNGTYKGDHKKLKDTEVDTEAVAHVLAETPTVEEALKKINASYAFVWYDAEAGTLNLIRNTERPLHIAAFHNTGLMFASEASMLVYAAEREDVKITKPEEIPAYTHVMLTLDGKGGYTRVDKKLDVQPSFHTEVESAFYEVGTRYRQHNPHAVAYQQTATAAASRRAFDGGKDDVKHVFATIAAERLTDYLFNTSEDAVAAMDATNSAGFQGKHYIEVVDYYPANDHKDCTAWHVYGTVIGANADETLEKKACTIVHWIVYNKIEYEIIDYTYHAFYAVKLGSTIMRRVTVGNDTKYMATCYASEQTELSGVPN